MIGKPFISTGLLLLTVASWVQAGEQVPEIDWFFQAISQDEEEAEVALKRIAPLWKNTYTSMIVDLMRLQFHRHTLEGDRSAKASVDRLVEFLTQHTKQWLGTNIQRWRKWTWSLPDEPHPDLAEFKGRFFSQIDPKMGLFFPAGVASLIRLDEVEWGGVRVNGIPPLYYPEHFSASEAEYLKDSHIVFGLKVNNEARAYPKRILAWHEMARDRLGGVELTLVYCTLCGTVIPYESEVEGQLRNFGTSGLLYRSNKLMFDEESLNLWSTLEGKPVVGSLVKSGLRLGSRPLVTTTWGEWRTKHPDTSVLTLNTGYFKDYSEGAAYRSYFASDRLMFPVPKRDKRLKNKQEVLVMLLPRNGKAQAEPLAVAISTTLLKKHPVYHTRQANRNLVIITSPEGANRVYDAGSHRLDRLKDSRVEDKKGRRWVVTEEALVLEGGEGIRVLRVPAQRAFWFGWYAQFPDTILVK